MMLLLWETYISIAPFLWESNSSNGDRIHQMSPGAAPVLTTHRSGRVRRFLEGTGAVAVWMTFGLLFHLSADGYLLLGVPITFAFQLYVRRAPLRAMWVRDAPAFQLGTAGVAIAIGLMIVPAVDLVGLLRSRAGWTVVGWYLAALAGAWAAAYALRYFNRKALRDLLLCLATGGTIGVLVWVLQAVGSSGPPQPVASKVVMGLDSVLRYVPVVFLLEEVWFRGVLDSHLHHPGEKRGVLSAIYVSALWGLWHYPVIPEPHPNLLPTLATVIPFHILIGVPLSLFWRRSGNLFVPATVHSFIDAVRNALVGLPV
jgi:membrane protease YdiL (CAAX protease family)